MNLFKTGGWVVLLFVVLVGNNGCKPTTGYQQGGGMPIVETTISADGEMIAALDRPPPHRVPRLRIKRLLPEEGEWQEVGRTATSPRRRHAFQARRMHRHFS